MELGPSLTWALSSPLSFPLLSSTTIFAPTVRIDSQLKPHHYIHQYLSFET